MPQSKSRPQENHERAGDRPAGAAAPKATEKSRFGDLHTRTYEMELLLSGALVFGLLKLPPLLESLLDSVTAQSAGALRLAGVYLYTYLAFAIYALLVGFLVHLATRAFWVGLVGLESVYPGGVRWDDLKVGPYLKDWARAHLPPLPRLIEKLDDVCSLIFSFAFVIVLNVVYSILVLAVLGGLAAAVSKVFFGGHHGVRIFIVSLVVFLGLTILIPLADRYLGSRVSGSRIGGRVFAGAIGLLARATPIRWVGPIQLTLQSNQSNMRISAMLVASTFALGLLVISVLFVRQGVLQIDSLTFFHGTHSSETIDARYYRSLTPRSPDARRIPALSSDVVEGPYLKLFLPYYPRQHNDAIRERCSDLDPFRGELAFGDVETPPPGRVRAAIDCLAGLHQVTLDGQDLGDARYDFTRDALNGTPGLVTYLPTRDLAPGRHELVVVSPQRPDRDPDDPERRHVIPFWK